MGKFVQQTSSRPTDLTRRRIGTSPLPEFLPTRTEDLPVSEPIHHNLQDKEIVPICRICEGPRTMPEMGYCESCTDFFVFTQMNGNVYLYECSGNCDVTVTNRKNCSYCRFLQCARSGMVWPSDAGQLPLYKTLENLRRYYEAVHLQVKPVVDETPFHRSRGPIDLRTVRDKATIQAVIYLENVWNTLISYTSENEFTFIPNVDSRENLDQLYVRVFDTMTKWGQDLPDFWQFSVELKRKLFDASTMEMLIMRTSFVWMKCDEYQHSRSTGIFNLELEVAANLEMVQKYLIRTIGLPNTTDEIAALEAAVRKITLLNIMFKRHALHDEEYLCLKVTTMLFKGLILFQKPEDRKLVESMYHTYLSSLMYYIAQSRFPKIRILRLIEISREAIRVANCLRKTTYYFIPLLLIEKIPRTCKTTSICNLR